MRTSLTVRHYMVLAMILVGAAGCSSDMDKLDKYINQTKARPGGRIEPLPEIKPYEVFTYIADAQGLRSPFVPDTPQVTATSGSTRPDRERSREYLEGFSLDTLGMVGTMNIADVQYGLVQAPDGLIHRVTHGNYLGENDGRITAISDSEIEVVEIISDGIGGYIERDAAVSLSD